MEDRQRGHVLFRWLVYKISNPPSSKHSIVAMSKQRIGLGTHTPITNATHIQTPSHGRKVALQPILVLNRVLRSRTPLDRSDIPSRTAGGILNYWKPVEVDRQIPERLCFRPSMV